jgi:hypothetical protein
MKSPTKNDCKKWKENPTVNPLTNRKIKENGPVFKTLKSKCDQMKKSPQKPVSKSPKKPVSKSPKQSIGKKLYKIKKDDCKGNDKTWIIGKGCFETKQIKSPKVSPFVSSLFEEPKPKIDKKQNILSELNDTCYSMMDNLLFEDFADMTIEELETIVKIGKGEKKNCYKAESIYEWVKHNIEKGEIPKDPSNPSHQITKDEIKQMLQILRKENPSLKSPGKKVVNNNGWNLVFNRRLNFYIIYIKKETTQLLLGNIPSVIEPTRDWFPDPHRLPSATWSSASVIFKIQKYFNDGTLFVNQENELKKMYPTRNLAIPLPYDILFWRDSRSPRTENIDTYKFAEFVENLP